MLDRYYRARYGDDSVGDFESIYERVYDFSVEEYAGLNEYLVPEIVEQVYYNDALWVYRKKLKPKEDVAGPGHNVMYTTMNMLDSSEKRSRRRTIDWMLKNKLNIYI